MATRAMAPLKERLLQRRNITESGCWEWSGGHGKGGYGKIWVAGKSSLVHRISYVTFVGPIPNDLHVLHTCDNPPCFNPKHLFLGTDLDNVRDMLTKGRRPSRHGERNSNARLTDDEVAELRETFEGNTKEVAERYGISRKHVNQIVAGRRRRVI